jgi:hypothetical protein
MHLFCLICPVTMAQQKGRRSIDEWMNKLFNDDVTAYVTYRGWLILFTAADELYKIRCFNGPPLWSSSQSSWLHIEKSRVRFPALPHFIKSSGSGTGSTQPPEDNWAGTCVGIVAAPVYKTEINGRGDSLRWPCDTLYPIKLVLTSRTSSRSLDIVRLRTKAPEISLILL